MDTVEVRVDPVAICVSKGTERGWIANGYALIEAVVGL